MSWTSPQYLPWKTSLTPFYQTILVMARTPPIVLIDDYPLVHASVRLMLRNSGFDLAGYHEPEAFLADASDLPPGIVLLDLNLPGIDGLGVQAELSRRGADQAVIFMSGGGTAPHIVAAVCAGAVDFLSKPFRSADLTGALGQAAQRLEDLLRQRLRRSRLSAFNALTERELLQGLADGCQSKIIAHRLGISPRTVEMHRANIVDKMATPLPSVLVLACEAGIVRAA
jgi:two-component system, LuxR family, response regulator FixJ